MHQQSVRSKEDRFRSMMQHQQGSLLLLQRCGCSLCRASLLPSPYTSRYPVRAAKPVNTRNKRGGGSVEHELSLAVWWSTSVSEREREREKRHRRRRRELLSACASSCREGTSSERDIPPSAKNSISESVFVFFFAGDSSSPEYTVFWFHEI